MAKFTVCKQCASRFGGVSGLFSVGKPECCRICAGATSRIGGMVGTALKSADGIEWETFSVASSFPRTVLVRESELVDHCLPGDFTSLKNYVNADLIHKIAAASGKKNSQRESDVTFEFNFASYEAAAKPNPIFVHGHYLKLSRSYCQSRWHCSDCGGRGCPSCSGSGRNYPSVEDELGKAFKGAFLASDCVLHASGREDVDVRCLGTGRPFVLEIVSPKKRCADLGEIEKALSNNENVRATGLSFVKKSFMDAVCNSHFDKKYIAIVSSERPLSEADAMLVSGLEGKKIKQQTPKRVLSRRVDIVRERKIFSIRATPVKNGRLSIEILAEAGTYIKELISSDGGRTKPSVSGVLSCSAQCETLDVVEIKDYFLETVRKSTNPQDC